MTLDNSTSAIERETQSALSTMPEQDLEAVSAGKPMGLASMLMPGSRVSLNPQPLPPRMIRLLGR